MLMTATVAIVDFSIGTVSADSSGGYNYTLINNGAATEYSGYTGRGGNFTIPSILGGEPVTEIGDYAFDYNSVITSVTIPTSVISIGKCCSMAALPSPR